jgi:fermentation-respiration switch protein FrsA (DUF1100 family)
VIGWIGSLLVAYVALLLLLRVFEKNLIFFPNLPGRLTGEWNPRGLPTKEDASFSAADGVKLHGWWIPASGAEFTFVAFHGNAANIANRAETYEFLHSLPVNVLAVEYRGYGRSEGSPSEEGLYLDALAAHDYLTGQRGILPKQIMVFGQSIGTAPAAHLATQREVGGIILEAPFPSARAVARRVYPFLPGLSWVMASKFETAEELRRVNAPVLVVHCTNDPVIAYVLGEQVFRAAREPKMFLRVEGYCHEEACLVAPAAYRTKLLEFLTTVKARSRG